MVGFGLDIAAPRHRGPSPAIRDDRGASLPEKDTSDPSGSLVVSALTMAEVALAYAARGWRVFPLFPIVDGRCGCGRACGTKPGKHPALKGWTTRATTDEATIRDWWTKRPNAGIGIATGRESALIVIDVDGREGEAWLAEFDGQHGALSETAKVITGRDGGGEHRYYWYPKMDRLSRAFGPASSIFLPMGTMSSRRGRCLPASGKEYQWKPDCAGVAEITPEIARPCAHSSKPSQRARKPSPTLQRPSKSRNI